jgi:hypothetical protein
MVFIIDTCIAVFTHTLMLYIYNILYHIHICVYTVQKRESVEIWEHMCFMMTFLETWPIEMMFKESQISRHYKERF